MSDHQERLRRIVDQQLDLLERMSMRGQFPSPQSAEAVRTLLAAVSEHERTQRELERLRRDDSIAVSADGVRAVVDAQSHMYESVVAVLRAENARGREELERLGAEIESIRAEEKT